MSSWLLKYVFNAPCTIEVVAVCLT